MAGGRGGWPALRREMDRWVDLGRAAVFWWRDDDASGTGEELNRLLRMALEHGVPPALAVIPARVDEYLATKVRGRGGVWVVQHGYAHVNHAPKGPEGEGAWELGTHRPLADVVSELTKGRRILARLFEDRFVPVLVPPWNHIAPEVAARLPGAGFIGLSCEAGRRPDPLPANLPAYDADVDLLRWKPTPGFVGEGKALAAITGTLAKRRESGCLGKPVGILTHHLDMDEAAWDFLDDLLLMTRAHGAARWTSAARLWPVDGGPDA